MFMFLTALASYAQEPDVAGTPVVGTGVPAGNPAAAPFAAGEAVSFTLTAGNIGTVDMDYPPISKFRLNITVQNMGLPVITFTGGVNYFDPPVITSIGNGRYSILITQNQAIPAGMTSTFTFSGVATEARATGGVYRVGYQSNGTPGSYPNTGSDNPNNFGDIDAALPVKLLSFNAVKEGKTAQLNWATTEESNSDRFEIEHSLNGKDWGRIGTVASHGESRTLKNYNFADAQPANGNNLYRLKMVDKDETYAYSRIQSLKFDGVGADLSIYPNPVADQLFVRDFSQVTQVVINDLNGRAVHQSGSSADGAISVKNLSAGMYIVRITRSNGVVSSQKIVIAK